MPSLEEQSRVVAAYRDAELYLLTLIREAVEGSATQAHYINQERELRRILKLAQARLDRLAGHIDQAVLEEFERDYARAVREAIRQSPTPVPSLIPTAAVESTALNTATVVASQHQQILRSVHDAYRAIQRTTITNAIVSGESNTQAVQAMLNRLADSGLTSFRDSAGRKWSMDTYVDMAVRTGRMRALNQGHMDGWQAGGVELVRVSQHPASHPWCYPFQGKLLAITGPAGPRTLTDRVTGKQITVTAVATFREALDAGYHHPNCRHSEGAYIPGYTSNQPDVVDEAENERQYKALQRQRQIERNIRQWKKRQAVALTPEQQAYARRKVRAWQATQRDHVKTHAFLTRRYEREQLRA
ncbi:phage minor capsid protein [Corynebacterium coyleae]|uniref:phage minor capsid protein n=1 Tax=Corynebacterium coyleae TaxID=53374 RepID=UPI00254E6EC4|nr:phage minor capsid protein [Corynebacterium coyleae]MDK8241720.1 minor capsid protein [Corynebacterium coyleae]